MTRHQLKLIKQAYETVATDRLRQWYEREMTLAPNHMVISVLPAFLTAKQDTNIILKILFERQVLNIPRKPFAEYEQAQKLWIERYG